ncbi:MAG: glycosyltransferase family 39 protein [Candidatus Moranbacteria bacterium]|nr:glycosyltransferase family 39 protein [Candidatus Moranbacteria bacterium]MDD3964932.1 glycosyltransferase family 39 protein [Candidatus Moranbacteria bacterium]
MNKQRFLAFIKAPEFILTLILVVFFFKGVFLSVLFPFFQAPDEQTHYATIQQRAEPNEKTWTIKQGKDSSNGIDISTYHFSEETIQTAQKLQFDDVKFQKENTQEFSQSDRGLHEDEIMSNNWKRYIDTYPANISGTISFYYSLGAKVEQILSDQSILTRLFSMRLLSVVMGVLIVFLAYLISQKIGFSKQNSLIITALVAFQPMFSASASQVNIDIALILAFSFYIYASVSLLHSGMHWKDILLLILSLPLAFYSKGPGIVLFAITPFLLGYLIYKRFNISLKKFSLYVSIAIFILVAVITLSVPKSYFVSITNFNATSKFDSPVESLTKYIDKTINMTSVLRTEKSYWGNFGWLDTPLSGNIIQGIWILEIIALFGIVLFFVPKRFLKKIRMGTEKSYLPEKKYILFFFGIMIALQLAIRFFDWRIFDAYKQILIGQPGRYFLPTIIPHIIVMAVGLGFFTRSKKQFDILIKTLLVSMILLSLHAMIDVIIPRYYL